MGISSSSRRRNDFHHHHHHRQNPPPPQLISSYPSSSSSPSSSNPPPPPPPNFVFAANAPYTTPQYPHPPQNSYSHPPPPPPPPPQHPSYYQYSGGYNTCGYGGPVRSNPHLSFYVNQNNGWPGIRPQMVPPPIPLPLPPYVDHQEAKKIRNDVNVHKDTIKIEVDEENPEFHLVSLTLDAMVDGRFEEWEWKEVSDHFNRHVGRGDRKSLLQVKDKITCLKRKRSPQRASKQGFPDRSKKGKRRKYGEMMQISGTRITIIYFAKEGANCNFAPLYPDAHMSVRIPFQKGLGQKFRQPAGTGVDLGFFELDDLSKPSPEEDVFPLVIIAEAHLPLLATDEQFDQLRSIKSSAQITQGVLEKNNGGSFQVKVVKQILWIDGVRYELREIYGIAKSAETSFSDGDSGKECVICMSEPKDTAVLPCRHMCLCSECAKELRLQTNKCPICRQPIEQLIEIRVNKDDQ